MPASRHLRGDCARFGAALDNAPCAVANSLLTAFPGSLLATRRKAAAPHGADVERRAFSGERFAGRGLHNAERFEESVLPAAGSAASRPGFQGRRRAGARSIVQRSERSRERAAPRGVFHEGGFRRAVRPLFADGRRRKIFRQSLPCLRRSPLLPNVRPFFVRSSAPRFRRRLPSLRAAVDSAAFQTVT